MDQHRRYRLGELDSALNQFYEAWGHLGEVFARVQEATERVERVASGLAPQLARDSPSGQVMERFLGLEDLLLEAGRVIDEVKRYSPSPSSPGSRT